MYIVMCLYTIITVSLYIHLLNIIIPLSIYAKSYSLVIKEECIIIPTH